MEYNIYIGYDEREDIAARICKYSIEQLAPTSNIHFLKSQNIPEYVRPREENQSTDFTYTRFMIPYINNYTNFSVFCDCDFLFLNDINDLMGSIDTTKAVSVVKHPPYIPHTFVKMDGIAQHMMERKNWASLMVFNNAHPSNKKLTPAYVNTLMPGKLLHQFEWLYDHEIGSISLEWNTLDNYYYLSDPKAIHYTDGGPWFKGYENTMYSQYWWKKYYEYKNTTGQQ